MPKLSIIIPVYNAEKYLEDALESLIHQSEEDFEAIFVNDGSTDSSADIIGRYCDEYVGFYCIDQEHSGISAARNKGLSQAGGDYVMFMDADDIITDVTVENMLAAAEARKTDIITCRVWYYGNTLPRYDERADTLAVLPLMEKYERDLLWSTTLGNKIFKRSALIKNRLSFADIGSYGDLLFLIECFFAGMNGAGVGTAVYEKRYHYDEDGFSKHAEPSLKNAQNMIEIMSRILKMAEDAIMRETDRLDGDEAYIQEVLYRTAVLLIDNFYRFFWLLDAETLKYIKDEFIIVAESFAPERLKKIKEKNADLGLPYIYESKEEAAKEPEMSLLLDVPDKEGIAGFIESLYLQDYPFFELFVKESDFDSGYFPEKWKNAENLRVLPDKNFFENARKDSLSRIAINIRDTKPLDRRVLREVCSSKAPAALKPAIFMKTRKNFSIKKTLKQKGF
ncbi:MAG: glycosyltransferase [Oscillospiraceae bacterium]|nr:glycosyltransferase [Oscillospiraceae bacterium]